MIRRIVWPFIIIVSTVLVYVAYLELLTPALRVAIVLWFILFCPGMAYVQLLGIANPLVQWTIAVAISFSIVSLTATVMLFLNGWSSLLGLHVIAGITLAGAIAHIVRVILSRSPKSDFEMSS
jgi:hypothetical protein